MFKLMISHHRELYDYLVQKRIPNNDEAFTFLHFEHFVKLISPFISNYTISLEIEKMIKNDIISNKDRKDIFSCIDFNFKKEIEYFISNTLSRNLKEQNHFSLLRFISFFLSDIQKQIQNTLFDSLPYFSDKHQELTLGEEKTDVLYMIVESNGSITIEKKDCTVISSYPYHQQEQSVAEALYFNPSQLIVFDAMHLLKPEMTICLKKILRKKVVFLEEEHPLYKNRKN